VRIVFGLCVGDGGGEVQALAAIVEDEIGGAATGCDAGLWEDAAAQDEGRK
jgi:hypothetical protein